jgi:hypothetical protein
MPLSPQSQVIYVVAQLHRIGEGGFAPEDSIDDRVDRIAEMGFSGTRFAFEWPEIEPVRGHRSWNVQDRMLAALESRGLGAFGLLVSSPPWARPEGEDDTHRPVVDGSAARGDTAFAAFAAAAARRYEGRIDRWEIWNEPNILRYHFWRHVVDGVELGPDPVDYLSLYELARDSILAVNPAARVAVGGLAQGPPWGPVLSSDPSTRWKWGYPAWRFLRGLLEAGLSPTDVAVHPYSYDPDVAVDPALDSTESVLRTSGYSDARIWITEWGIDRDTPGLTAAEADSLTWRGLARLCSDPWIDLVSVFALTEDSPRNYGLLDRDFYPTPTGRALSKWIARRQPSY